MSADVFAMRAPSAGLTCHGKIYAFPSQLHPFVPPTPGNIGGGSVYYDRPTLPGCRPHESWWECRKRKDEEAMIVLGLL